LPLLGAVQVERPSAAAAELAVSFILLRNHFRHLPTLAPLELVERV
jgi:hypothetical protein